MNANRLLYNLKECFFISTWTGQQYQYLKHGGDNPVANTKMTLGQVVASCVCACEFACARARVCVCVCVRVCVHHTSPETMHSYVYIKRKCFSFL